MDLFNLYFCCFEELCFKFNEIVKENICNFTDEDIFSLDFVIDIFTRGDLVKNYV